MKIRTAISKHAAVLATITGLLFCGTAAAGDWEFSIGANYRTFEDIDFEAYEFNNPEHDAFIDADQDSDLKLLTYTVDNGAQILNPGPSDTATVRNVTFNGGSDELDEAAGFILGASKPLDDTWSFDLSLATVFTDNDNSFADNTVSETSFQLSDVFPQMASYSGQIANPTSAADIETKLEFNTDMDVYTIGAGLSARRIIGNFAVSGGVGPALTLADYDMSRAESVSWVGGAGDVYPSQEKDDDGLKVRAGGYADLSLKYFLTESMGVEIGGRYDWIPDEVHTDFGDIDLSGFSGQFKLTYKY